MDCRPFGRIVCEPVVDGGLGRGTTVATTAEDFKITIYNDTHVEVKVKKFEYKDDGKWNTENFLGADGIQKIEPEHGFTWTRDLRGIGDTSTQFRVTYSHHIGGTKWGDDRVEYSDTFVAHDKGSKRVTLTS